jgi:phospholipid/cholesterol/gamma-HCH transport system substrate-binding protein
LPSQRQVKWAQLRVGLTVIFAVVVLAVLIFLMTGTGGLFTPKIIIKSYFDNAGGVRVGAPVALQGVTIGNVSAVKVVPDHGLTPVEIDMRIVTKFAEDIPKDAVSTIASVGVLGEAYIDIDRTRAVDTATVRNGDVLKTRETPELMDVVRSSQSSLQNIDTLVRRIDRIVSFVESGQGSIGHLIYDQSLYNRLNSTLTEVQNMVNQISSGQGSIGKLVASDELYQNANASVDKLNAVIDQINSGQGSVGKLIKDPSLYDNANQTVANLNKLTTDMNSGKGAIGKLAKDEEFARKLDNTITKLSLIMNQIESGQGTAGRLIKDPSLYTNADQMLIETRNLLSAVRQDPKKYLTIKLKLF